MPRPPSQATPAPATPEGPGGRTDPSRGLRAAAVGVLLLLPRVPAAAPQPLRHDLRVDLPLTAVALAFSAALSVPALGASRCRWCTPGPVDAKLQEHVVWQDPQAARHASDLLANVAMPALALGGTALSAWAEGEPRAALVDALVIVEAASVAQVLDATAKDVFARRRPGTTGTDPEANRSFYSGHASLAFSLATATGTVASMRGYPAAPWLWATGLVLASATGYLRVAGNAHWSTDVLAGAVLSGATGWAVPWFLHRPRPGTVALVPAPGGFALLF